MSSQEKNQKKVIRKRYLARLREAYAQKLFSKFLNELSGTLTMKNHKGTWRLVFSYDAEMFQSKGKTLADALINLACKSPLTPEGECNRVSRIRLSPKTPSLSQRVRGEEFKSVSL